MSRRFETIINVCHPQSVSASTEQHCSAMRMDNLAAWTSNQLMYAITDWKDIAHAAP